jgi:hypothetical protein
MTHDNECLDIMVRTYTSSCFSAVCFLFCTFPLAWVISMSSVQLCENRCCAPSLIQEYEDLIKSKEGVLPTNLVGLLPPMTPSTGSQQSQPNRTAKQVSRQPSEEDLRRSNTAELIGKIARHTEWA